MPSRSTRQCCRISCFDVAELLLAAVAVGRPVRGEFTYLIPEQLAGRLLPGQRIRVPFGRGSALGFYLGPAKEASAEAVRLKPIERELEREPSLPPDLVSLLRFAAGHYRYPLGEAIRPPLPPRLSGNDAHEQLQPQIHPVPHPLPAPHPAPPPTPP